MRTVGRDPYRKNASRVLISWVAVNNDPFEREWPEGSYRLVDGDPVPGPTLTVLTDEDSRFAGTIGDVVLLHRDTEGAGHDRERHSVERRRPGSFASACRSCVSTSSHGAATTPPTTTPSSSFCANGCRSCGGGSRITSWSFISAPCTPSMQTIWVLMAETGFINPPFILVKSYRRTERRRAAPSRARRSSASRPSTRSTGPPARAKWPPKEQGVVWDPGKIPHRADAAALRGGAPVCESQRPGSVARRARDGEDHARKLDPAPQSLSAGGPGRPMAGRRVRAVQPGDHARRAVRLQEGRVHRPRTSDKRRTAGFAADGDTLFLDEVGDVSPDLQRLLHQGDRGERSTFPWETISRARAISGSWRRPTSRAPSSGVGSTRTSSTESAS